MSNEEINAINQEMGAMRPWNLRFIADFMDLADRAFVKLALIEGEKYTPGDGVQKDLRRWAEELEQDRLVVGPD